MAQQLDAPKAAVERLIRIRIAVVMWWSGYARVPTALERPSGRARHRPYRSAPGRRGRRPPKAKRKLVDGGSQDLVKHIYRMLL